MVLFSLEHRKAAYRADFALYRIAVALLAGFLLAGSPDGQSPEIAAWALADLAGWTAIEYALHRFVLHGLRPFSRWHAAPHQRPMALIVMLVFLPALLLGGLWRACALTLGVLAGYLAFSVTHHATHRWRTDKAWLKQRKHWHALHHNMGDPGCYGVTSAFWDHVFGSIRRAEGRSGTLSGNALEAAAQVLQPSRNSARRR